MSVEERAATEHLIRYVQNVKPVKLASHFQSRRRSCRASENDSGVADGWQFPVYLTLMLTGLRPCELVHLLLPVDLDLEQRLLFDLSGGCRCV